MEDLTTRTSRHALFKSDHQIWGIVILLACISILAVYSTSSVMAYIKKNGDMSFYIMHHIGTLLIGLAALVIFYLIPSHTLSLLSSVCMAGAIGLLLLTPIFGLNENEAIRRISLIGFTFQTSDAAKVAVAIFLARQLSAKRNSLGDWRTVFRIFLPVLIAVALIFPFNFSTAALLFASALTVMYFGQVRFWHLCKIAGVAGGLAVLFIGLALLCHTAGIKNPVIDKVTHRVETWVNRVERFGGNAQDGEAEDTSLTTDYQAIQAELAIATGGLTGKGFGHSTLRYALPHPYSDFIYAIIIEETGIVGGLAVLVLYIWFFFRVKRIVKRCDRTFPAFLAIGLAVNILYQAFMHMGVAVGVFPVTGQTLPFVSMGGSSLLFTGMSFGIILRISREVERRKEKSLQETTGDEPAAGPDPIPNVEYEQATV